MKKIIATFLIFTLLTITEASAFINNPYGISYTEVYEKGDYLYKILNIKKRSIAKKAGMVSDVYIDSINNDDNLNMKNIKTYFESHSVSINTSDNKDFELKGAKIKAANKSIKLEQKFEKYLLKKNYKKALKFTNKYIKKYPYDTTIVSKRVKVLIENEQYGDAIKDLEKLYETTNSPKILGTISTIYISMDNYEMAEETARKALKMDENELTSNATMYVCSIKNQKYQDALKYANKLVFLNPKSYTVYYFRGITNLHLANFTASYNDLQKSYKMSKKQNSKDTPNVVAELLTANVLRINKTIINKKEFVDLPFWHEICAEEYLLSNGPKEKWNLYWEKRRERYLNSVDNCIANYNGQQLCKCYENVRQKELLANEDYKIQRNNTWQQEKREEIYRYVKDVAVTVTSIAVAGALAYKAMPKKVEVKHSGTINHHYSGSINYNHNFSGSIRTYQNHYLR